MTAFTKQKEKPEFIRNITNFSEDQISLMKTLHLEKGYSANRINKEFPEIGSLASILRFLRKEGIYEDPWDQGVSLRDRKEECREAYLRLGSFRKVALEMGVSKDQVDFCMQKYWPNLIKRKPVINNVNYFETIDSASKAYILGFISADGCILESKGEPSSLFVGVNIRDKEVLDFILSELNASHTIRYKASTDSVSIHVSNKKLVTDLVNLGVTPRKSLTMRNILEAIPKEFRYAYVTGLVDGDGSIGYYKRVHCSTYYSVVSLVGTLEVLRGVKSWLEDELKISACLTGNKNRNPLTGALSFSKKEDVLKFFKEAYNKSPFHLSRKYSKFLENEKIKESVTNE